MVLVKILVPYPTGSETISIRTLLFNNLITVFKKNVDIKIQRLLYQPEKLDIVIDDIPNVISLDLRNYKNAFDVLKKEKPDLIYANPYAAFIDYSFCFAAKKLNIPVFTIMNYENFHTKNYHAVIQNTRKLFSNNVEVEISKNKKSFLRRAKFIIYKLFFMVKTIYFSSDGFFKNSKNLIYIMKLILIPKSKLDPNLGVTKQYLRNKIQEEELLSMGFKKSSLLVTGHPMFDHALKNLSLYQKQKTGKISVLLLPDPFYESGEWTKKQHEQILEQIIKIITRHKTDFSIRVKIHPSSSLMSEYEPLIHSIDPSIPIFQKGSVEDFLKDSDVVLTYSSQSTALIYSILQKKPIVIFNIFSHSYNYLVKYGLAKECTKSSLLKETIMNSLILDESYDNKRKTFIEKYFFKDDGLSSERICQDLLELLNIDYNHD